MLNTCIGCLMTPSPQLGNVWKAKDRVLSSAGSPFRDRTAKVVANLVH